MIRKTLLAAAFCLLTALLSSGLMAQSADVTAEAIDQYVNWCNAAPGDRPAVMSGGSVDAATFANVSTKISLWAGVESQPFDEATKKTMLTSNPALTFSDAELALLAGKADALKAAYANLVANP
jgi:copper homeostasis protein CutC